MSGSANEALDDADLTLVRVLSAHARTEVHALAARLGTPSRRVRARLRRLERRGVVRGYHAVAVPAAGEAILVMLRFVGDRRPTADELSGLSGVRRVHELCTGWDFMVEFGHGELLEEGLAGARSGVAWVLGRRAEFEVLTVRAELPCASDGTGTAGGRGSSAVSAPRRAP